jgi:hypothetical protein
VCLGYSNGFELQDLWEYDPALNTWTAKANFSGVGRGSAIADVVNGKAYVGTGFSPSTGFPIDLWEYNPVTNAWAAKATMPGIALYESHTFSIGDTMYVVGGCGGSSLLEHNEFWAYSVSSNSWTQKTDFPGGIPRWYATTFSLGGIGYCGYGSVGSNYQGDFYSYDPSTGWAAIPGNGFGMLFNDGGGGVATSSKGYCISGVTSSNPNPPTTDLWEYVPLLTSISEISSDLQISIYPNPATGTLNISLPENQKSQIQIFNAMGMLLKEIELSLPITIRTTQINISDLPDGLYFIQLKNNSQKTQKFIKQ